LLPGTPPSAIEREVPAFGASLAAQAAEILNTGTCAKLEAFRRGGVVRHRDGRTRAGDPREAAIEGGFGRLLEIERTLDPESAARLPESAAASARPASASLALVNTLNNPAGAPAGFGFGFGSAPGTLDHAAAHASSLRALPGFGRVAVARLALAGLDTADKARDAARAHTAEAAFLTPAQVHALERHEVLAEPVPREDFEEMRAAVEAAIGAVEIRPSAVENATERTREASEGELPGGDSSREGQLPGGDSSREGQLPGGDSSREGQLPGGDSSREGELPGGDSSRDDSSRRSGWRVVPVGGARRSRASHDADFVIAHPSLRTAEALRASGAFAALVSGLDATGRLARAPGAFRQILEYPPGAFAERAKALDAELDGARQGNLDLHSKLFGLFLCGGGSASSASAGGRYRRLDAVVVPFAQLPFATVGWTGSKCYNRLLRHHASRRGLCLTSHALVRRGDRRWVGQVADDPEMARRGLPPGPPAPSRDADGNDWWPPGWDENRRVETERDVFELLGVPYREPNERDAPG
jgi:DNA polymerase mu